MRSKRFLPVLLVVGWLAGVSSAVDPAQPRPQIKGAVQVPRDSLVILTFKGDLGKASCAWEVSPATVTVAPGQPDGQFVFNAKPGTYTVRMTVIDWDARKFTITTESVTIGGELPPPPPDPDKPPPPQSELAKTFQAAYDKGKDAESLALFKTAMRDAVEMCRDTQYMTVMQLTKAINAATKAKVGAGKLPALGSAIGEHLAKSLPATDRGLNQDDRAVFLNAYSEVAKAVAEIRP